MGGGEETGEGGSNVGGVTGENDSASGGGVLNDNAEMEDNNSSRSFNTNNTTYGDVNPLLHGGSLNETSVQRQEYQRRTNEPGVFLDLTSTTERQTSHETVRFSSASVVTHPRERDEEKRPWDFSENQICTPSYRIDYRKSFDMQHEIIFFSNHFSYPKRHLVVISQTFRIEMIFIFHGDRLEITNSLGCFKFLR